MALIGKIRRNKPLLVGTLAGALALFILMLMFDNPNQSLFGGSQTLVGEIEGRKLDVREFQSTHDMLYRNSGSDGLSSRAFLWNYFVDEAIVKSEAEAIGLGVSPEELIQLQFSEDRNRLSSIISSRYQNPPNSGQVDMEQLRQLKEIIMNNQIQDMIDAGQLIPDFPYRWAHQEKEVIKDALQTKISNMVSKGLFTPSWQAEMISEDQNQRVDFLYVQVPFDEIDNSDVTLEDSDYQAYFEENKHRFKQDEETRRVSFVTFNVVASADDSTNVRKKIGDLVPQFRDAENDSLFVENNRGTIDGAYYKKEALSATIADTAFSLPIGSVYGPYLDVDSYKAMKVLDRKVIPDSVSARHILRRADDQQTLLAALNTIDSLKGLIESGVATFDSLAITFSEDRSNSGKGGDLGTFGPGAMVKEFNDVCFFKAELGEVYPVVTQFGVHLVEVTDKVFQSNEESVQLAYVSEKIIPSTKTQGDVRELALVLQEDNKTLEELQAAASAQGLNLETSPWFDSNAFSLGSLGSNQGSRDIVQWAFGVAINAEAPDVGDVSPRVYSFQNQGEYHVNKYAVAALQGIRAAGIPSYDLVKDEIEADVINRKKAQIISDRIKGQANLQAMASAFSTQVDTALSVTFASPFIQKAAVSEPKVVATAFNVDLNQVSEPIEGGSGVFVVMPTNKPAASPGNVAQARSTSQQTARITIRNGLVPAMRKNADIEDNRSRFF